MKYLLFLLLIISNGCGRRTVKAIHKENTIDSNLNTNLYRVESIDSIPNFYIIYASKGIQRFKILSNVTEDLNLPKIKIGNRYDFSLFSIFKNIVVNGKNVSNIPHIECLRLNDSMSICIERQNFIFDIYKSKNLKGVYFSPIPSKENE